MRTIAVLLSLMSLSTISHAEHLMQHGFVISNNDKFASHLVANGHHSWQADVTGSVTIDDQQDRAAYEQRKAANSNGGSYFLLQAQNLDLPSLKAGQVLTGHIIESKVGNYEPNNTIVRKATFTVDKVLLNMVNPFFVEP